MWNSFPRKPTADVLHALEVINLWMGGVRATLRHLKRFPDHGPRGQRSPDYRLGDRRRRPPTRNCGTGDAAGVSRSRLVGVDNNPAVVCLRAGNV